MNLLDFPLLHALLCVLAIFITTIISLAARSHGKLKKKAALEVAGGWPLIGHLSLLSGPELPYIVLSNLADEYGPIFSIRLGTRRGLIVSTWDIAKECFTTNDAVFSNRPMTAAIQHMGYNFAMFGFSNYGPYWRELRKTAMVKLLSSSRVKRLGKLFDDEVRTLMRSLHGSCMVDGKTVPVEMKKLLEDMMFDLMMKIIAGDHLGLGNGDIYRGKKWRETVKNFFRTVEILTMPDVFPFLKRLECFGSTIKVFKKTGKEMDSVLQRWLDELKKVRESRAPGNGKGFMEELMDSADGLAREFPVHDADTICKANCQSLMLGGTGTISVTLTWALCLLLNNQRTLERAQEELDSKIGRGRCVQESDLEKLEYIRAVIKETMRLYPPAPLLPPRESIADCTVAGYHVPAGTRLIINAWKLQRDPSVWSDPLEFQPERFLNDKKDVDVRGLHFELLPFGSGRRVCPGITFSLQVMELTLAIFLHGFNVKTTSGGTVDMTGSFGSTNLRLAPLEVLLKPRLSPHLYG